MLSLTNRRWEYTNHLWREGAALAGSLGLHPTVAHILAHRGITDATAASAFLSPQLSHLPNPSTLKDITPAVERLHHALQNNQKIAIFGDYDVDGTCATALLTLYLRQLGSDPYLYIPDRLTEGYGPTPTAMQAIAATGAKLLLTVDTGISAHEALTKAAELGLDVIVTDHHPPARDKPLPPAIALINPQRTDDVSGLHSLSGSGVAFYLAMALNRHLREQGFFTPEHPEPKLTSLLGLVALATVADVMQLVGPNRVLVARGLASLNTWQHVGLSALASAAGHTGPANTHTAGFVLGPRLNAAGRIDSAHAALNLLLAPTEAAARPLAERLESLNDDRRTLEKTITTEALDMAEKLKDQQFPALVLYQPHWHPGLVGIVASRVKDALHRPVFVLGGDANGHAKGSARSVPVLDIGAAVHAASAYTLSGGGHAMAAGVTLLPEHIIAFTAELNLNLNNQLQMLLTTSKISAEQALIPPLFIDAELAASSCNTNLFNQLNQLAPFGMGNPQPVLAIPNVSVTFAKPVGAAGEHLKLRLSSGTTMLDAIAFGATRSGLTEALSQHKQPLTVAGTLHQNTWNGTTKLDIHVLDAHPSSTPTAHF